MIAKENVCMILCLPFQNVLFLFCGKRTDRIKALVWKGDGFVLLYKRLESGKFQWHRTEYEARAITQAQFRWLTEGLAIDQPKAVQKVYPKKAL